jgi:hypothetical protein
MENHKITNKSWYRRKERRHYVHEYFGLSDNILTNEFADFCHKNNLIKNKYKLDDCIALFKLQNTSGEVYKYIHV